MTLICYNSKHAHNTPPFPFIGPSRTVYFRFFFIKLVSKVSCPIFIVHVPLKTSEEQLSSIWQKVKRKFLILSCDYFWNPALLLLIRCSEELHAADKYVAFVTWSRKRRIVTEWHRGRRGSHPSFECLRWVSLPKLQNCSPSFEFLADHRDLRTEKLLEERSEERESGEELEKGTLRNFAPSGDIAGPLR